MKSEVIVTEDELPADVIAAIKEGNKIKAIKLLREATGLGLANAKVLVDRASRTQGPRKAIQSFEDQPSGLSTFAKFLALLLCIAGALYFIEA